MTVMDIIEQNRLRRRANVPPRFLRIHTCSECGRQFLCPDRYDYLKCIPSEQFARIGKTNTFSACLPCSAYLTLTEREAWYEANGVRVLTGKDQ